MQGVRESGMCSIVVVGLLVFAAANPVAADGAFVTPSANTNIIGITPDPNNIRDLGLKQQQEPSCIVRPNNPAYIFCAYNDLRAADQPSVQGDSWMGVSMSNDSGQTWFSRLSPGYLGDTQNSLGMGFAADPSVVAIPGNSPGLALLNYIAAFRDSDNGVFAVQRWVEYPQEDQDFWKPEDGIHIIADGAEGRFIDKSAFYYMADEFSPQGTITEEINVEGESQPVTVTTPTGTLIAAAAIFTGNGGGAKIVIWKSYDNGKTWTDRQKISEEQNEVTGVSIAAIAQNFVIVYRRKGDSNDPDAIMSVFCSNTGNQKCTKGQVVFELCPFDQPASGTTFRTFSFPWAASDGDRFWALAAARNPGAACTESPTVPGYFEGKSRIVVMSSADGKNWVGAPGSIDEPFEIAPRAEGFQAIPVALGTKGRVDIAWYDTFREEDVGLPPGPNDLFVNDYVADGGFARVWRKADVWMTRLRTDDPAASCGGGLNSGCMPAIESPVRVSQYETVTDSLGNVFDIEGHLTGLPLYGSGTLAFKGDYIALATRLLRKASGGKWIPNYLPEQGNDLETYTDQEDIFVAWGDNRDVRAEDGYPTIANGGPTGTDPNLDPGNQMPYSPPGNSEAASLIIDDEESGGEPTSYDRPGEMVAEDQPDDSPTQLPDNLVACGLGDDFSRARDANVYGAFVRDEASLVAPTASKPLGTIQRMFPLVLTNVDPVLEETFCLQIENQPLDYTDGTGLASFYQLPSKATFQQGDELDLLEVTVSGGSSASRAAYVTTSDAASIVTVKAYLGTCPTPQNPNFGTLVSRVDLADGGLVDPEYCESFDPMDLSNDPNDPRYAVCLPVFDQQDPSKSVETHNITFAAPVLQTPVLQTPTFQTPTFQTPTFQTPTFQTPTFQTPTFQTPTFQTPTFQTPTLQSSSLTGDATYTTDTMEAPTLQSDTFATTANTNPTQVYYQDVTFPVEAAANVITTYSADIQINDELDRDTSEVQLIAWTPNVYATAAGCVAQPAADQQIIAYKQLNDTDLSSLTLPFTISEDQQDPYRGEVSFFGQPNRDIAVTVRIWAVDKTSPDPNYRSALDTLQQREISRQDCLANPVTDTTDEIAACENLGTRGLITFGASSHSCITTDADENTDNPAPLDCLNNGSEKILDDKTGPAVTLTFMSDFEADGTGGAVIDYTATASDNVDPNPTLSCLPDSGETVDLGGSNIICEALDNASPPNQTIQSFPFTVVDTTSPELTAPGDITVEADATLTTVSLGTATASDVYDGTIVPTDDAPAAGFPVGTTPVTWTATDSSGNFVTAEQVVTVEDMTAPAFDDNPLPNLGPFDADNANGKVINYDLPGATDAVNADPVVTCMPAPGFEFPLDDTPVSCTATDGTNTSPVSTFTVSVTDQTAPSISAPATVTVLARDANDSDVTYPLNSGTNSVTVEANVPPTDGAAITFTPVVSDAVSASPDITCTPASGTTLAEGTTIVECSAFDGVNTSDPLSFSITVEDTTDPVFDIDTTVPFVFEADVPGGAFVDLVNDRGVVATDRGAEILPTCIATPQGGGSPITLPNTLSPGDYDVVCSVAGAASMTTVSITVIVEVNDEVPPVLNIPAGSTATVMADPITGTAIVDLLGPIFPNGEFITATDVVDTAVTIVCTPPSGTFDVGTYVISCTASDDGPNSLGQPNTTTLPFTLIIADVTPPSAPVVIEVPPGTTINANGDIVKEAIGADTIVSWTVSSTDNADNDVATSCTPLAGSLFTVGTTGVVCTAQDDSGNSNVSGFNVIVQDTTDPTITAPADVTTDATGQLTSVNIGTATAIDDVGPITITNDAPASFPVGTTTVTWTATDDFDNSATATQNVTVQDMTAPTITVADITIERTDNFDAVPQPSVEVDYLSGVGVSDLVDPNPTLSCAIDNPGADVSDNDPVTGTAQFTAYGTWQVTCTASDSAMPANTATETFNISIVFPYGIDLVLPKGNTKAGSTIPIDWYYLDESLSPTPSGAITPTVNWIGPYMTSNCAGTTLDTGGGEDAGSSAIRLSSDELKWQFSWQTPSQKGWYVLVISPPGAVLPDDIPSAFDFPASTACVNLK